MASCGGWGNTYTLCYIDKPEEEEITDKGVSYPVRIREIEAWSAKVEYNDNKEPEKGYIYERKKDKNIKVYEYDKLNVIEYEMTESGRVITKPVQYRHGFTEIPLIEWKNNKLARGNSQNAVSLMDAYDRLFSTRKNKTATKIADTANDTYLRTSGDSAGVRSYGEVTDLLVSWHYQRVILPSITTTEKKFDPFDEKQVDLSGIVHAKEQEPVQQPSGEGGGVG